MSPLWIRTAAGAVPANEIVAISFDDDNVTLTLPGLDRLVPIPTFSTHEDKAGRANEAELAAVALAHTLAQCWRDNLSGLLRYAAAAGDDKQGQWNLTQE